MRKKLSVIIPVYNTEKWIEECITSVQNGGYANIEIIVINDGSQDNSESIINRLIDKDPRIIYLYKKNSGAAAARDTGVELSTGDYVMFLDADDYVSDGAIAEMMSRAELTDGDMVFTDAVLVYNNRPSALLDMNPKGIDVRCGMDYLINRLECYQCMRIFKKERIIGIKQQRSPVCEDLYMMVQILPHCSVVEYIKKPLYYYRQTEHSIMRASRQRTVGEWLNHALEMRELLPSLDLPTEVREIFTFENVHTIYRFIKEGNRKDKIYSKSLRTLIHATFKDLRVGSIKSAHRVKLSLFLLVVHIIYGK